MTEKKQRSVNGLVKKLRSIRDKMNAEIATMTADERRAYFNKMRAESSSKT